MAANVSSEDERERRVILVGNYFLENPNASTRSAAKYFSDNFFKISNYTIHDYLQRYKRMIETKDEESVKKITEMMDDNKPDTVADEKIKERVLYNTKLFLDNNMTVDDIANSTGVSFWTVYRDLKQRLAFIDEKLYMQVNDIMHERSFENINRK